jgi:uncharacterized membrane protein YoaK (UPF0700 family)
MAFPIGLGFVAGFIDIFGFMAWFGLLAAHVTGNLIFLAVDIARGDYSLVMKLLALPIFAASVAVSTWFIAVLNRRRVHPFLPIILVQAAMIVLCMLAGLVLPPPRGADDVSAIVMGSIALFAMAMQNTAMRRVLHNLPPTTVMTGNVTFAVSEAVHWMMRLHRDAEPDQVALLSRRAKVIGCTLAAFTVGAIAGGLAEVHVGYISLLLPITALLALLPLGNATLREADRAYGPGSRCHPIRARGARRGGR